MNKVTFFAPAAALALLTWGATANAVACTAFSDLTNPDATLTNSLACGPGILDDNNDDAANIGTVVGGTWTSINRVNAPGTVDGVLTTTGTNPAGSSGSWAFNAVAGFNSYVIVIKDGGSPGGSAPSIFWTWFRIDTAAGCDPTSALSGRNYCGLWTMYGDDSKIKNISHISLYGSARRFDVPEPGSLALIGLGLLGLAAARRRRV